ncbi:MAG: phage baseplate assembly protein [Oligoflexales bacterium]
MKPDLLARMLAPIKRSIASITAWGKIHKTHNESQVQASFLTNETIDKVPILYPFGFASRPNKGSKCFAICNGNRRNLKIISVEGKPSPTLQEGESLIYTNKGNYLHCKSDGSLDLVGTKVLVKSDKTNLVSIIEDLLEKLETKPCVDNSPLFNAADLTSIKSKIGKFK